MTDRIFSTVSSEAGEAGVVIGLARTILNTCYVGRSSRPAELFSFGLLDGLQLAWSPSLARSPGGLQPRTFRDGIHELSELRSPYAVPE